MIPAKIRRIGLSLAALSLAAGLVAAQVSETIQPSSALEQAREDFYARRFSEAATKLQSLVESEPENHQARYWLVRALIRDKKPKEALIEAETAAGRAPNDAYAQLALGDALFRKGQFGRAELAYYTALRINPEAPRAYLGIGVVNMAEGRRRSAKIRLRKAFELDPNDMDIVCELATCLPESEEETDLWARYACEATDRDAYELANALAAVTLRRSRPGPTKLVTPDGKEALSIPLHEVWEPTRRTRTDLYLEVRTNGRKPRKFLLDTGASGLLMLEKDARKDGVQPIAEGRLRGVGDDGTRAGSLGWAETVQIGDVRFENFPVRMAKKRVWGEEDGIIGTDVFRAFRVSINPDRQTLSLERLPDLPDDDLSSYDAPAGPPVGFSKMRIVSSKILIDALIADNVQGCLLLAQALNSA